MDLTKEVRDAAVDQLKTAQLRKVNNLNFFKEFHPGIYQKFKEYKLDHFRVSFNTDVNQLDILCEGKSIYNSRPIAESKETLSDFYQLFSSGKTLRTLTPPFGGYDFPRFFHKKCNSLITHSPITKEKFKGYKIPDFYPLMIFNGVGAGYHISEFLADNKIINCLITEADPDLFACSLYTVDWEMICEQFIQDTNKNIHFIIGPFDNSHNFFNYVMRYLASHCPLYPLTTLFINHNNEKIYKEVTTKVNEDTYAFVSVWGYYDDEINQINNCIHNIHLKNNIIELNDIANIDIPIFIIGAGPSLDENIETIKKFKGEAIIVSCGTALGPLHHHGIKPDIQFELESHQITLDALKEIGDDTWIKSIPILGPAQLSPSVYKFFNTSLMYFKAESVTSMLFGTPYNSVKKGTPTCTNGALATFAHWGFKKIYLFGMDFGYRDMTDHHAKGSVYYSSSNEDIARDAEVHKDANITIESVDGGKIQTKPMLYTAKRSVEMAVKTYTASKFYNCSNGAKIDHTEWIENTIDIPIDLNNEKNQSLKREFLKNQFYNSQPVDISIINERLSILSHNMNELNNYIETELSNVDGTLYSMTFVINNITSFLENKIKPEVTAFYYFMRGSLWHLFYIGYAHALSIENTDQLEKWINHWKSSVIETMTEMRSHFESIVFKEFDYNKDIWVKRSTSDPED